MAGRVHFWTAGMALVALLLPGCAHGFGFTRGLDPEGTKDKSDCQFAENHADQNKPAGGKGFTIPDSPPTGNGKGFTIPETPPSIFMPQKPLPSDTGGGPNGNAGDVQPQEDLHHTGSGPDGAGPTATINTDLVPSVGAPGSRYSGYGFPNVNVRDPFHLDTPLQPAIPITSLAPKETDVIPPPADEKKVPLVLALENFLHDNPIKALECLQEYDQGRKDVFQYLLPVLAQMTQKKLDQLSPEEQMVMYQQLDSLMACMRAHTELLIDQMCFCQSVKSFGDYEALPADHQFRARIDDQQVGDSVQIYVQLRNLCSEQRNGEYETKLVSSVRVVDASGEEKWFRDFTNRDGCLHSRTLRHDHFFNFSFYVPHLEPGNYTLTVEIRDVTRPGSPRTARKSLPFCVRS